MGTQQEKTVTVAQSATGQTVVVNNARDGAKKYGLFFLGIILAAIAQGCIQLWPNMAEPIKWLLNILTATGLTGGGVAMTSPFDKRGIVINDKGITLQSKTGPESPTPPSGTGFGLSVLALIFCGLAGSSVLTACDYAATVRSDDVRANRAIPLVPVATATKCKPVLSYQTSGLKNPGAAPGETFGDSGETACGHRQAVDGWLTVCMQPNDGDEFDDRNSPPVFVFPEPKARTAAKDADSTIARSDLKRQFPGLLGP